MFDFEKYYVPGGFHPVHLGDVFDGRYHIFRKLGVGSQSTVWLARDARVPERRYVAIKVFKAKEGDANKRLDQRLHHKPPHPGNEHVEASYDSFAVHGLNGTHHCAILKPLGRDFSLILEDALDKRRDLRDDDTPIGAAIEGDPWSLSFAKKACWQVLLGLDSLHSRTIAHRDIRPGNLCLALQDDLSALTENEIQKVVWTPEPPYIPKAKDTSEDEEEEEDSDSESDDPEEQERERERERRNAERKRRIEEKWKTLLPTKGDEFATPHSNEWNAANLANSRNGGIYPVIEEDDEPPQPGAPHYTIEWEPLEDGFDLEKSINEAKPFSLVLSDLGFACTFDECEERTLHNNAVFAPPEDLMGLPSTHKADIFSLGLTFWSVVMLQELVYPMFSEEETYRKNRQIHDLVLRLGPFPSALRAKWRDAEEFLDVSGQGVDTREYDEDNYGEDNNFQYGDIREVGRAWKPLDMIAEDLGLFIDLVQKMLQFEPELRPSTTELLKHGWFKDMQ